MSKFSLVKEAAEKALLAEQDRTDGLAGEGNKLAAGIIIVLGFQLLDVRALLESSSPAAKIFCHIAMALLGLALLLVLCSRPAKGSAGYPRGFALWDSLKPETVSEEAAEEAFVQMLLKTREQNARLNDAQTRLLHWCRWVFFAGILAVAGSQLLDAFAGNLD